MSLTKLITDLKRRLEKAERDKRIAEKFHKVAVQQRDRNQRELNDANAEIERLRERQQQACDYLQGNKGRNMKQFTVSIDYVTWRNQLFVVTAETMQAAKEKALGVARDHDFSDSRHEYSDLELSEAYEGLPDDEKRREYAVYED